MATISIEGLETLAIIGVYPHEREKKQRLILDLEFELDISQCAKTDEIGHTLDYDKLSQMLLETVNHSAFKLIESLVQHLADLIEQEFAPKAFKLKVSKPDAIKEARNISISLSRQKTQDAI